MNICLVEMTNEKMHEFFKEFTYDPAAMADTDDKTYIYSQERVNQYFEKHQRQGNIHFAIMLEDKVIGDVYLKDIDNDARSCEMGIHISCDQYKGKGYGTQAESLLLDIVFHEMNINVVRANTFIKNERSRRVLEKVGFREIYRDNDMCYYECRQSIRMDLQRDTIS